MNLENKMTKKEGGLASKVAKVALTIAVAGAVAYSAYQMVRHGFSGGSMLQQELEDKMNYNQSQPYNNEK